MKDSRHGRDHQEIDGEGAQIQRRLRAGKIAGCGRHCGNAACGEKVSDAGGHPTGLGHSRTAPTHFVSCWDDVRVSRWERIFPFPALTTRMIAIACCGTAAAAFCSAWWMSFPAARCGACPSSRWASALHQLVHHDADDDHRSATTRCAFQRGRIGPQTDRQNHALSDGGPGSRAVYRSDVHVLPERRPSQPHAALQICDRR